LPGARLFGYLPAYILGVGFSLFASACPPGREAFMPASKKTAKKKLKKSKKLQPTKSLTVIHKWSGSDGDEA